MLSELKISKGIVEGYTKALSEYLSLDVAIVGGGPSGLVAGYYLAKEGTKVALFEKKLSIGGGMWGGGMMFNKIVVQKEGVRILEVFDVDYEDIGDGYFLADAVQTVGALLFKATKAGLRVFNVISVEDVVFKEDRVCGLVINWSPVEMTGLHVDPLTIKAKYVVDATGHGADITSKLVRKTGVRINTPSGGIEGERPLWADRGEQDTVEYTKEVYPGLFVCGMAAVGVFGGYRMGPIFGGMFLSGERVAQMILRELRG